MIAESSPEGSQTVFLEPNFLRSRQKFGFLVTFDFIPKGKLEERGGHFN